MSVPGESLLNIGLSFTGFGQLVQVQQAFAKTGQIVNGTVEYFKHCQVEFGNMVAKMATTYNTPEKILNGVNKAFKGAAKTVGALHDFYIGFNKDIGTIEKSLGKISPNLKQLFSPLAKQITGPVGEFAKILGNVQDKIQLAAKQYTKLKKAVFDVADSFTKVQSTVPAALQVFQDPKRLFNPDQWSMAIFPAIDSIGQLKESSLEFVKSISSIPGIDKFAAKIGELGAKVFPILKSGLMSVIPAVWSFTTALLANPITWIVVGVIALGAAILLLWKNWDKVVTGFQKGFQWFKGILSKAPNWVLGLLAAFVPFVGIPLLIIKNWGAIVNFFKNAGSAIGSVFGSLWEKAAGLFTRIFGLIGSIVSKVLLLPVRIVTVVGILLISLLGKAFEKIGLMLSSLWGKVVSVFTRIVGVIVQVISSAWGRVMDVFNSVVDIIGSVFNSIIGLIGPVLASIRDQVVNVFAGIGNAIGAVFSSIWNTVIGFIMNGVNFIGGIIGGILDFFNGIVDSIESAFNAVWSGIESIFQSIGKMFENIVPSWAKGLFNWAVNPGGSSPGKNAPNPAKLDSKITTNSVNDRQAANQLNQSRNNRTINTKNTKVDKIEINLTGGKNDQQTAKTVRNELMKFFGEQGAATVGG